MVEETKKRSKVNKHRHLTPLEVQAIANALARDLKVKDFNEKIVTP